MKRDKCISCKHYEPFFNSCNLYQEEVYLGEGDSDLQPVNIKNVSELECEYMEKEVRLKGTNCIISSSKFFGCAKLDGMCLGHPDCYFKQLKRKEQECEALKGENFTLADLIKIQEEQLDDDNVIIERFLIASGKSKDITEPDEFEEVFQDIEQTYSEHEELNKECKDLKQALDEIEKIVKQTCSQRCTNDCLGTRKHCGYGHILDIINQAKEQ